MKGIGHWALTAQNHVNVNTKKHKHYGSKYHQQQKHHTNSNPHRIDDKERHSDRNLMTGITKIELHTTQKGINLMIDITIEIKVVMISHQKQIPMTGIAGIAML